MWMNMGFVVCLLQKSTKQFPFWQGLDTKLDVLSFEPGILNLDKEKSLEQTLTIQELKNSPHHTWKLPKNPMWPSIPNSHLHFREAVSFSTALRATCAPQKCPQWVLPHHKIVIRVNAMVHGSNEPWQWMLSGFRRLEMSMWGNCVFGRQTWLEGLKSNENRKSNLRIAELITYF